MPRISEAFVFRIIWRNHPEAVVIGRRRRIVARGVQFILIPPGFSVSTTFTSSRLRFAVAARDSLVIGAR